MNESPTPHVHFSRAQKWDLFRMTAAAVVSTGFFAAPVVFSDRNDAAPPAAVAPAAEPQQRVELVTTDVIATATTPELQLPSSRRVARAGPATRSHPRVQRASLRLAHNQKRFPRRVARLIAGDGRYTVRPFPTVELAER
jgi:hypothetical protein